MTPPTRSRALIGVVSLLALSILTGAAQPGSGDNANDPADKSSAAVATCDRLAANPRDPQRMGEGVKSEKVDTEAAVATCREAVAQKPGTARLQYQLGRALQLAGENAEAAEWYQRAADGGSAVAKTSLGSLYEYGDGVAQDDVKAAELYRAAMPDDPWSFASLAYLTENGLGGVKQDHAEALRLYRLGSEAGDTWADVKIGEMYEYGTGVPVDYAEAMRWYDRAVKGDEALAYVNLGNLYADGHGVPEDDAEAERLYQVGIDRGLSAAKNAMAYHWAEQGRNLDAALKLIDEALQELPEDGDFLDTRAWVLFHLKRYDEAASVLEGALDKNPYDPALLHAHLGEVYAARGEKDRAREQWTAALQADPTEELADKVRKKLAGENP
jgi:TPR repeat protein